MIQYFLNLLDHCLQQRYWDIVLLNYTKIEEKIGPDNLKIDFVKSKNYLFIPKIIINALSAKTTPLPWLLSLVNTSRAVTNVTNN